MAAAFFKGTSIDQDFRYNDKTRKQVNKIKGIQAFDSKVDITRVYRPVINEWIAERINKLLGFDDEIVVNMIQNLLDEKVQVLTLNLVALDRVQPLEARMLQHQISGFLEKDAPKFTQDLWKLMLSAQENPNGIPQQILDAKKQEIKAAEAKQLQVQKMLQAQQQQAAKLAAQAIARQAAAPAETAVAKTAVTPHTDADPSEQSDTVGTVAAPASADRPRSRSRSPGRAHRHRSSHRRSRSRSRSHHRHRDRDYDRRRGSRSDKDRDRRRRRSRSDSGERRPRDRGDHRR